MVRLMTSNKVYWKTIRCMVRKILSAKEREEPYRCPIHAAFTEIRWLDKRAETDRPTDRQTDRQSDRQTDRPTNRQTDRPTEMSYQRPYIALLTETEYLDFSYKCKALIM
ncbi:unnamed protein product [Callosobruchus maculatus]|uniref:Uncharacterized protein n=1 Tax=Callosobruchus maculatus TaxID=64391 RepID=A0A653BQZ4_CALMS|nr:unnamed protein product [Callosobruchus maculatus]